MRNNSSIQLLAILVLTLSIIAFPSTVRADPAPTRTTAGTQWFPAGPNVDKLQINVFTDELSEYQNGLQGHTIDLTDWTIPATVNVPPRCVANCIGPTGSGLYVTAPNSEFGMFDIDINHANTFFGIPGGFGNDGVTGAQCPGTDCTKAMQNFAQGIAHLIDKAAFIGAAPTIGGNANPLDSALPPGQNILHSGLPFTVPSTNPPTPATCAPTKLVACAPAPGTATGSYTTNAVDASNAPVSATVGGVCGWDLLNAAHVAAGQTCQSAYKYGTDASTNGVVTALNTNPDFCDAAAHWQAAGLGTGVSTVDCHLLGFAPLAGGASTITFIVRNDSPPRFLLGQNLVIRLCELINGAGQTCTQIHEVDENIVTALGNVFSTKTLLTNWHLYTAGWGLGSQFDQLFALYNSAFSSNGCISTQKNVRFGQDYIYFCNSAYDTATNNLEFANSYSVAVMNAQVAMDIFGSHVATIPVWSGAIQFGYVTGWTNVNDATGVGPPNFTTLLNTWARAPATAGVLRWGFKQGTGNLNPYLFTTVWEAFVVSEVYDSLLAADPYSPTTLYGWMVNSFIVNPTDIKMVLKPNLFFHDNTRVTASDVKFSLLSFQQAGGSVAGSVADVNDVNVVATPPGQPSPFDITLIKPSPFAQFNIGGVPIVPQHLWAVDKTTPCTVKGTNACTLDTTLLSGTAADPIVNHTFIGSGPFQCVDLVSGAIGGGCTQTAAGGPGTQSVDVNGKIILQRTGFGFTGADPLHSYFRSSAQWKLWQWSDSANIGTVNVLNDLSAVEACAGKAASTLGCGHFDTPAATITCTATAAFGATSANCFGFVGSTPPPLGGNQGGTISSTEVSQVEGNALQTWTPGVASYPGGFTGALSTASTIYEGGISYCPFVSGATTCP